MTLGFSKEQIRVSEESAIPQGISVCGHCMDPLGANLRCPTCGTTYAPGPDGLSAELVNAVRAPRSVTVTLDRDAAVILHAWIGDMFDADLPASVRRPTSVLLAALRNALYPINPSANGVDSQSDNG